MFVRRPSALGAHARRYAAGLTRAAAGRRCVVWGAGRAGAIAVTQLRRVGIDVALVVDADPLRHAARTLGVRVAAVDALRAPADDFVVLASMHAPEMAAALEARGAVPGRDFEVFPAGAIYQPEAGFALAGLPAPEVRRPDPRETRARRLDDGVTLLASAAGNFYFRELRDFLADGLERTGWRVTRADERADAVSGVPIVIGPHEFFTVGHGVDWLSADNLRGAVLVTTEQPQSIWTQTFARALALAGAVVDISHAASERLTAQGVPARWLPLGWYDGCGPFDQLPRGLTWSADDEVTLPGGALPSAGSDPWSGRPLDVLFVGASSPRRERLLDGLRRALPHLRWAVHIPPDVTSAGDVPRASLDTPTVVALARRAKVLVNLHRDESTYFEWQRIVWRGLWQRTLVITEPVDTVPGLEAGRHFIAGQAEEMAGLLHVALDTDDGRRHAETVRRAGCDAARRLPFDDAVTVLADAVDDVGSGGVAA